MKTISKQFEMNLGSEPFRLASESGTDGDRVQAETSKKRQDQCAAAKAQWWFGQMRVSVERAANKKQSQI